MRVPRVRRHMNVAGSDGGNIAPATHIALATFVVTNSRHGAVGSDCNRMTASRRNEVFRRLFHVPCQQDDVRRAQIRR